MNQIRARILHRAAIALVCLAFASPTLAQEQSNSKTPAAETTAAEDLSTARQHEKLWQLDKAATLYERFAETGEASETERKESLRKAATYRDLLGEDKEAVENYEAYLKLLGDDEHEKADEALFAIARIYKEMGDDKEALRQYERILKYFEGTAEYDALLEAHAAIATHFYDKEGKANRERALTEFEKVIKVYESAPSSAQRRLSRGRDAAALAKFRFAEELYEQVARMDIKGLSEDESHVFVEEQMKAAEKAQQMLEEVLRLRRPEWAIAALYRMGSLYEVFAETVRNSPIPDRLNAEQKKVYQGLLKDRAETVEAKAVAQYEKALDVAHKQNWYNHYSKEAAARLTALTPEKYPDLSATFSEPVRIGDM